MNHPRWMKALAWGLVASLAGATAWGQTFTWTGIGNGWANQTPPDGGGDDIILLSDAINTRIDLSAIGSSLAIQSMSIDFSDPYVIGASDPFTLSVSQGIFGTASDNASLRFNAEVTLALSGTPTISAGANGRGFYFFSQLTGSPTTLTLAGPSGSNLSFNNAGNTYTGNTVIGSAAGAPTINIWNSSPFGSGNVSFYQHGFLNIVGAQTIANNLTFGTNAAGTVTMKAFTDPVTFSGSVTLANNTTLVASTGSSVIEFANGMGMLNVPGPMERNPIVFTGNIGESGGSRSIQTSNSPGILIFNPASGSNTYSGGTSVFSTLVFGKLAAIGGAGANVLVGTANTTNAGGYVGLADVTPGNFANFLGRINPTSSGSVGVDTLPGNSIVTLTDNINLSSFTTTATDGMRLGTATQAILTGTITPDNLANYHFGNGGGTLYVQSNLNNVFTSTGLVMSNGNAVPLKLFLQGATTYSGVTAANSGFIVFDNGELPSSSVLRTGGSATSVGGSYIGITDFVDTNPALYMARFDKANSWGIVGFDTHQGHATASYANVDLTGFNNGVFLGTATQAELTGTLTPSSVANGSNAANTLRLTAGNGGSLRVNSTLADINVSTPLSVMLGSPFANEAYSSGTVILSAHNTYTGDTTLNGTGLTLGLANNAALGFGDLHLASGFSNAMGVSAVGGPITLANDIIFDSAVTLHVLGSNPLTFTGELSGTGTIQMQRAVTDTAGAVTLSHDNSSFTGALGLQNFHLTLTHDRATGGATLNFFDEGSSVTYSAAALNPVIAGISSSGNVGRLGVHDGAILTFASNNDDQDHEFGGVIADPSGNATTAAVVVTSTIGEVLRLYGNNLHSGGTTITDVGVVLMGHNNALGTGTVTLNAPDGGLLLERNVTLTNNLNYLAGGLGGFGTIDPGNLSVLTIGANQMLLPGTGGGLQHSTGTLHIAFDTAFANGGEYAWTLQDATTLEGASKILINGDLDLTGLSAGGFTLSLRSLDLDGNADFANLVVGNNYDFTLLTTAGSILGFIPSDFTIDASDFQGGTMSAAQFLLSSDGQNLTLSFTAVPEPSTWALLLAGAGVLGWTQRRRRAL